MCQQSNPFGLLHHLIYAVWAVIMNELTKFYFINTYSYVRLAHIFHIFFCLFCFFFLFLNQFHIYFVPFLLPSRVYHKNKQPVKYFSNTSSSFGKKKQPTNEEIMNTPNRVKKESVFFSAARSHHILRVCIHFSLFLLLIFSSLANKRICMMYIIASRADMSKWKKMAQFKKNEFRVR